MGLDYNIKILNVKEINNLKEKVHSMKDEISGKFDNLEVVKS